MTVPHGPQVRRHDHHANRLVACRGWRDRGVCLVVFAWRSSVVAVAQPVVSVVGMKALRRDMDRLGADTGPLYRALAAAGKAAAEPVAAATRETLPRDRGGLVGTVRTSGTKTGAAVRVGTKATPYVGPVDFGGWPGTREYIPTGRYLFPAAQGLAEVAATSYAAGTQRALDAFNWSNTSEAVHD